MPPIIKKWLWILVAGFGIYAVLTSPERAADIVRAIWDIVSQGFMNIVRFFNGLMNG